MTLAMPTLGRGEGVKGRKGERARGFGHPFTRSPLHPFLLLLAAGCAPKPAATTAPAEQAPVPVTVAPLQTLRLPRTVAVVGTLAGFEDASLTSKVDGRVARVFRDVGDTVQPGEPLLELEPTDYELAVAEAKRSLEAELAKLGLDAAPPPDFDLMTVPLVARAQVALENSASRYERARQLFEKGTSSREDYDTALTDYKLADVSRRAAVTEARATLAAARFRQASLETAEQRLRDTVVRAPVPAGWGAWAAAVGPAATPLRYAVAARMVSEGEMIRSMPVTNVFRLVIDHVLKLRAAVPETFVATVKVGQPVEVRVDGFPDRAFAGRVTRVNPTVDPLNRTFLIEAEVPNCGGELKAGGFARASVLTHTDGAVKTVPPTALVSFAGVTKVFVLDGATAKAVEVRVGQRDREWVEVIGPVPDGAKVIVTGLSQLVDGSPVRVRE